MLKLSGADIRQTFLNFFEKKGHTIKASASLIPNNPTVLLTPAGMLPFVPIFLGIEPAPNPPRATSSQKCARVSGKASDLSYVGRTPRHHTFFEMLGNFSFGDYFKENAIAWAWELITEELKLPEERLWVTVHHTDQEARQIWHEKIGVPQDRILDKGDKDNFWGPPGPTGPCGPCTEIFYDRGPAFEDPNTPDEPCEGDRYMEIWNLVFMQLFQDDQGKRTPLDKKNVDTGMGLERITMVMQGVENTFETDLFFPILKKLGEMTGHRYKADPEIDIVLKIVTDHMRCVAFCIADGIIPSNEGRGYIIRMILRRAIRYAKKLGLQEPMLFKLISTIRDIYQDAYPEIKTSYQHIVDTVKAEEKRFLETLSRGSVMLDELIASSSGTVNGEEVFKLYDTYGFPVELTAEILEENGLSYDEKAFEAAMQAQKEKARGAKSDKAIVGNQIFSEILKQSGATQFLGYDALEAEGKIVAIINNGEIVSEFGGVNQPFEIVLDQTPFYGESGGQVGDRGIFYVANGQKAQTIVVKDTQKVGDLIVHSCLFDQGGSISVGQTVQGEVNPEARIRSARHHSATHLLNAALRKVLGEHVNQAGSYVSPDGARFDFTFPRALKPEELNQLEMIVNTWVLENTERDVAQTSIDEAKAQGAIAMFNEKYGDTVRVVSFGSHSKELCGGTHVERLGDIGLVKITTETAVAAGIRRIEFVAGELALHQMLSTQTQLEKTAVTLKVPANEVSLRAEKILEDKKQLEKTIKQLQEKLALSTIHELVNTVNPSEKTLLHVINVEESDTLKFIAETLNKKLPDTLIFLGANIQGKAQFIAIAPDNWIQKGIKAGDLVKTAAQLCEGGGGGKPNMAQAGGKRGDLVSKALEEVKKTLQTAVV